MSAEVIAHDLDLELYVVDLATVVDKYVGETEKNLERIFTAAAGVNAVLLFDEADAVFGKRSEVRDAHDRYANVESAYLLQRMESFDGLAILATNLRANIDDAFTRRLDVMVDFPLPDATHRRALWDRCLGTDGTPRPGRRPVVPRRLVRAGRRLDPLRRGHRRLPRRGRRRGDRHAPRGRPPCSGSTASSAGCAWSRSSVRTGRCCRMRAERAQGSRVARSGSSRCP